MGEFSVISLISFCVTVSVAWFYEWCTVYMIYLYIFFSLIYAAV